MWNFNQTTSNWYSAYFTAGSDGNQTYSVDLTGVTGDTGHSGYTGIDQMYVVQGNVTLTGSNGIDLGVLTKLQYAVPADHGTTED